MKNAKGNIYYGMHFYPGVAEYQEAGKKPYRVFLNEDTIRKMGPSFQGRPVFVMHVDDVEQNVDKLRNDADGWVIESFFNTADGKHWSKFVVVSEKGERAIKQGMRLSNCYAPTSFSNGGFWNGVSYDKEITDGEYEHLAIVPNPRYEESVIMTPEQFKKYNEDKNVELKRLANDKEGKPMKLKFFKRAAVENSSDLESVSVMLPKSGREVSISDLVKEADESASSKVANSSHLVKVGDEEMTVAALVEKFEALQNAMEDMKKEVCNEDDEDEDKKDDEEKKENEDDMADDEPVENEDDKEEKDEKKKEAEEKKENKKKKNEADVAAAKKAAKEKADRLRNAHNRSAEPVIMVNFSDNQVARGKARYGSN